MFAEAVAKSADERDGSEGIHFDRPDQKDDPCCCTYSEPPQCKFCAAWEVKILSGKVDSGIDQVHGKDDGETSDRGFRDVVVCYPFDGTTFGPEVEAKLFEYLHKISPCSVP